MRFADLLTAAGATQLPPRNTRLAPVAGPSGSSAVAPAGRAHLSWHHFHTFPDMSYQPLLAYLPFPLSTVYFVCFFLLPDPSLLRKVRSTHNARTGTRKGQGSSTNSSDARSGERGRWGGGDSQL